MKHYTESAGNLSLLRFFRDYTPEFICCIGLGLSLKRVLHKEYSLLTNPRPKLKGKSFKFAYYLAGLIEGDGTIHLPISSLRSKGSLNYPSIQIAFHFLDLPLALLIPKEIGDGSISKKKNQNAYIYTNNLEGLFFLVDLLNGKMKTNKIYALHRLIDWYNQYKNTTFEKKGLNTDSISSNAWLSGFIEDGHFSRSTETGKYPRIECKFEVSKRQKDQNKRDNFF